MDSWVFWVALLIVLINVFDEVRASLPKFPRGSFKQMKLKVKYKRWQ